MHDCKLFDTLFQSEFLERLHFYLKKDRYFLVWNILFFLSWTFLRTFYFLVVKALFKRFTKKPDLESDRFVDTSWNFCFYCISTPLGILSLEPGKNFEEHLKTGLVNRDSYSIEPKCSKLEWNNLFVDTSLFIALLTGFHLHSAFDALRKTKPYWPEIILKIFFGAFLLAIGTSNFTVTLITMVGTPRFLYELSKLLFNFGSFTNSVLVKYSSYFCLVVYSIVWVYMYVWILPSILNYKKQQLAEYIILSLLMCVTYGVELVTGPVSRVLFSLFLNKTFGLEYYLYGTNLFGKPLYVIKQEMIEQERKMRKIRLESLRSIEKEPMITLPKSRENSVALYQTVKCYIRMRKKLKAVRKQIEERRKKEGVIYETLKKEE
ncbi:hypothetical protein LSTR_LSTR003262 [Laodelphax striatellus]|uniref:Uncharacterized protein n=1 Tax=Laodelphax striatellus TaxID=195883 RepID=A0A482XSB8_LAOST|nr:hypothetical protein LSTR_LSTR003262 [Laodelphax striatellus]